MFLFLSRFQNIKDTILKANHNKIPNYVPLPQSFSEHQRYNFESKSQHSSPPFSVGNSCFQNIKDTILKANHNL